MQAEGHDNIISSDRLELYTVVMSHTVRSLPSLTPNTLGVLLQALNTLIFLQILSLSPSLIRHISSMQAEGHDNTISSDRLQLYTVVMSQSKISS